VHPVTGINGKLVREYSSTLGVVGRYVLTPGFFIISKKSNRHRGEIQLTDGIASLLEEGERWLMSFVVRYDCGSKLGYLKATVAMAPSIRK
jgi:UTP--glucose-1-phosphate uridylyltransferase